MFVGYLFVTLKGRKKIITASFRKGKWHAEGCKIGIYTYQFS